MTRRTVPIVAAVASLFAGVDLGSLFMGSGGDSSENPNYASDGSGNPTSFSFDSSGNPRSDARKQSHGAKSMRRLVVSHV
jgi:hypothetical protein